MKVLLARFACDESGATAVEYGLIAAAMSAAIITMILGSRLEADDDLRFGADRPQVSGSGAPWFIRCPGHRPNPPQPERQSAQRAASFASVSIDDRGCGF